MRCTKCHYLSFEPEPRCRNCGHDLSLEGGDGFSLAEAPLEHAAHSAPAASAVMARPKRTMAPAASRAATALASAELPLFMRSIPGVASESALLAGVEDEPEELEPLVRVPARPRLPIAVRRTTPDPAKLRAKYGLAPTPEPDLLSHIPSDPLGDADIHGQAEPFRDLPLAAGASMTWPSEPTPERLPAAWHQSVGAGPRLAAAVIDAALLGSICAAVLYLTLRITGLGVNEISLLPVLPLAGLFLMFAAGYLLMFTVASGQTVGKMALHIRVVGTSAEAVINDRVTMQQAVVRTMAALPSVLAFGAGFVPALVGAGLAVHDRIAQTRVVRL